MCNSPFCACRPHQTHTFPSGGGASRVPGLTMRRASFAVNIKIRHSHQEVGHITFTARQRAGRTFPQGVSRSWLNNVLGVCLHLNLYIKILLFIQFISYMFYNVFCWFVRTYGIHFYFISFFVHEIIPISIAVYCYMNYSYSLLYCSFNIIFWPSYYCFLLNAYGLMVTYLTNARCWIQWKGERGYVSWQG